MPTRVVIVGDLPGRPERGRLLALLGDRRPQIMWEWIQPVTAAFNLPERPFSRLLSDLRDKKKNDGLDPLVVVKLNHLNGRDQHALYKEYPDPIEPPSDLADVDQLAAWLLSGDAGIIGQPWQLPVRAAALIAILSKLIRNKSWNKDTQGHHWTKEADLLGQAPVYRPDGKLYGEAHGILGRSSTLLLCKGGKQGTTPLGWCIRLEHVPAVKRAISTRSLAPLQGIEKLSGLIEYIDGGSPELVMVDGVIVSERVRAVCRELR